MTDRSTILLGYWATLIRGDDNALRDLYDGTVDSLYAFGTNICREDEIVKDAIQDLFIDLLRYRNNLDTQVKVLPYLYSSLRRKLVLALKKQADHERLHEDAASNGFPFEWDAETAIIKNEEERSLHATLARELAKLSDRQKEVLYLRFNTGMTYEEVSAVMHISVASCRTLVYRTVKQLREKLDEQKQSFATVLWLLSITRK